MSVNENNMLVIDRFEQVGASFNKYVRNFECLQRRVCTMLWDGYLKWNNMALDGGDVSFWNQAANDVSQSVDDWKSVSSTVYWLSAFWNARPVTVVYPYSMDKNMIDIQRKNTIKEWVLANFPPQNYAPGFNLFVYLGIFDGTNYNNTLNLHRPFPGKGTINGTRSTEEYIGYNWRIIELANGQKRWEQFDPNTKLEVSAIGPDAFLSRGQWHTYVVNDKFPEQEECGCYGKWGGFEETCGGVLAGSQGGAFEYYSLRDCLTCRPTLYYRIDTSEKCEQYEQQTWDHILGRFVTLINYPDVVWKISKTAFDVELETIDVAAFNFSLEGTVGDLLIDGLLPEDFECIDAYALTPVFRPETDAYNPEDVPCDSIQRIITTDPQAAQFVGTIVALEAIDIPASDSDSESVSLDRQCWLVERACDIPANVICGIAAPEDDGTVVIPTLDLDICVKLIDCNNLVASRHVIGPFRGRNGKIVEVSDSPLRWKVVLENTPCGELYPEDCRQAEKVTVVNFWDRCNQYCQFDPPPLPSFNIAEVGTSEPGTSEPGTSEPGTSEPGTSEPGTS